MRSQQEAQANLQLANTLMVNGGAYRPGPDTFMPHQFTAATMGAVSTDMAATPTPGMEAASLRSHAALEDIADQRFSTPSTLLLRRADPQVCRAERYSP